LVLLLLLVQRVINAGAHFRQSEVREALLSLKQIPAVAFNVCESLQCAEANLSTSLPPLTDYESICTLVDQHCV